MSSGAAALVLLVASPAAAAVACGALEPRGSRIATWIFLAVEWLALAHLWMAGGEASLTWSAELGVKVNLAFDGFGGAATTAALGVCTVLSGSVLAAPTTRTALHVCRGALVAAALSTDAVQMMAGVQVYLIALGFLLAGHAGRAGRGFAAMATVASAAVWIAVFGASGTRVHAGGGRFGFALSDISDVLATGPNQYWMVGAVLVAGALLLALPGFHLWQIRVAAETDLEIGTFAMATGPIVGLLILSRLLFSVGPLAMGELAPSLSLFALLGASVLLLSAFTSTGERRAAVALSTLAATWFAALCTAGPAGLTGIWLWALPACPGVALYASLRRSSNSRSRWGPLVPALLVCGAVPGIALVGTVSIVPRLLEPTTFLPAGASLAWIAALHVGAVVSLVHGSQAQTRRDGATPVAVDRTLLVAGFVALCLGTGLWPGVLVAPIDSAARDAASEHRMSWCGSLPMRDGGTAVPRPLRGPCASDDTAGVVLSRAYRGRGRQ